jgi:hypothetical protein
MFDITMFGDNVFGYVFAFGYGLLIFIQELFEIMTTDNFLSSGYSLLEWFIVIAPAGILLYLAVLVVGTIIPD